jgi:hypothetical protein
MIDKLELYHHGSSVCAAKVRFYLAEKDLPWEGHYIDILKGEQFTPDYIKLNPKAVVPTLIHDGTVIRDSTNICEYLDDVFPERQVRLETPGKPPAPTCHPGFMPGSSLLRQRPPGSRDEPGMTIVSDSNCVHLHVIKARARVRRCRDRSFPSPRACSRARPIHGISAHRAGSGSRCRT